MYPQETLQRPAVQGASAGLVHSIPTISVFVPNALVAECKSFRDACHLAWKYRTRTNMTFSHLVVEIDGLYASHASEYFSKNPTSSTGKPRRELPAAHIAAVERELGNRAISQYLARVGRLTLMEEIAEQWKTREG